MAGKGHRDIFARDMEWGQGTTPGTQYVRYLMDEADPASPSIVLSKFAPGEVVAPHTHGTNYCEYVIAGEQTVGKTLFRAGDVRIVKAGTGYGPLVTGPEGCTVLIVFQQASGAMMQPLGKAKGSA